MIEARMSWRRVLHFGSTGGALVFALISLFNLACRTPAKPLPSRPTLIAHAGGGIEGGGYSNAREAFDLNYEMGHRYFEADLSWTSDGRLVLVHDWDERFSKWFLDADARPTLEQFQEMRMRKGLSQMSLADLYVWMLEHEDVYVVTDVKEQNVTALRWIARSSGGLQERFIPQVYQLAEFGEARELGYRNIILTLYRIEELRERVFEFAMEHDLFAITMPPHSALDDSFAERLTTRGVFVYVHTINSLEKWNELRRRGVTGIYTDFIRPADIAE